MDQIEKSAQSLRYQYYNKTKTITSTTMEHDTMNIGTISNVVPSSEDLVVMLRNANTWKQLIQEDASQSHSNIVDARLSKRTFRAIRIDRNKCIYNIMRPIKMSKEQRLRIAASHNDIERVETLLETGVPANNHDELERTPLHLAAGRGYAGVVKLLLQHGADPSVKDCAGNTPLHLAAIENKIDIMTLLLESGADPLLADRYGHSPLQLVKAKLRLLQKCKGDNMERVKQEVQEVVNMLITWIRKRVEFDSNVDSLSSICSRLTITNSQDELDKEVQDLSSSIDTLLAIRKT